MDNFQNFQLSIRYTVQERDREREEDKEKKENFASALLNFVPWGMAKGYWSFARRAKATSAVFLGPESFAGALTLNQL